MDSRVKALEQELAFCRENHGPQHIQQLEAVMKNLTEQNQLLLKRQQSLLNMVLEWDADHVAPLGAPAHPAMSPAATQVSVDTDTVRQRALQPEAPPLFMPELRDLLNEAPKNTDSVAVVEPVTKCVISEPPHFGALVDSPASEVSCRHDSVSITPSVPSLASPGSAALAMKQLPLPLHRGARSGDLSTDSRMDDWLRSPAHTQVGHPLQSGPGTGNERIVGSTPASTPLWTRMPMSVASSYSESYCPWLSCPDIVSLMPDLPSPQDLLFGSPKNPVANSIYIILKDYNFGLLERLACGWLVYVYTKWRICPSEERYLAMPSFFRPTPLQLSQPHCPMLDNLVFPRLRESLIEHAQEYDLDQVLGIFAASLKLNFPANLEYVRPDDKDRLTLSPSFMATLVRIDSWTLGDGFLSKYPQFFEDKSTSTAWSS